MSVDRQVRTSKPLTIDVWVDLAPECERYVPTTYDGTELYDRVHKTLCFANPTPEGRERFRALFRVMSLKAKARGYRKATP